MTKMESVSKLNSTLIKEEVILTDHVKEEPEEHEAERLMGATQIQVMHEPEDKSEIQRTVSVFCITQEPGDHETEQQCKQPCYKFLTANQEPNDLEDSLTPTPENNDSYLVSLDINSELDYVYRFIENKDKSKLTVKEIPGKFFKCFGCDLEFMTISLLKDHLSSHFSRKKIFCMECRKTYKNIHDLIFHVDAHSNKFEGIDAKIDSNAVLNLNANIRKDIAFWESSKLVRKYNDKCFKCNFNDLDNLKKHVSKCDALFVCRKCIKYFKSGDDVTCHMELHKIRKPFECDKCVSKFLSFASFKEHLKSHEESDLHRCKMCYEEFKFLDSLIYHYAYTHFSKLFICLHCNKSFRSEKALAAHKRRGHKPRGRKRKSEGESNQKKRLKMIKMMPKSPINVVRAKMGKKLECDNCTEQFEEVEDLKIHKKNNHVKKPVKTYSRKRYL